VENKEEWDRNPGVGNATGVPLLSLTPHIDRVTPGIKAGMRKARMFTLVGTLLGDPQEPAGRRARCRVAFRRLRASAGLCTLPAERGAGSSLRRAAAVRDEEAVGKTKLRQALGRQIHIRVAPLKSGNSAPAPTYTPSGFLASKASIYRDAALSFPMLVTATSCIKLLQLSPCFSSPFAAVENSHENRPDGESGLLACRQRSPSLHRDLQGKQTT